MGRSEAWLADQLRKPGYGVRESLAAPAPDVPAEVAPQRTLLELRELSFILPMPPSVNEAWHHNGYIDEREPNPRRRVKVRTVLTDEHRRFRSEVIFRVRQIMKADAPLAGRLELVLRIYQSNARRMDIDNRVKPLQDALTEARAYADDSQIDRLIVERIRIDQAEECGVVIREIAA